MASFMISLNILDINLNSSVKRLTCFKSDINLLGGIIVLVDDVHILTQVNKSII
jgi:hypothetical protein